MSRLIPYDGSTLAALLNQYSTAIWPLQLVALAISCLAIYLVIKPTRAGSKIVGLILTTYFLWIGVVYHGVYYATLDWAAWFYSAAFVFQAFLLFRYSVHGNALQFQVQKSSVYIVGITIVVFTVFVMPIIDWVLTGTWAEIHFAGLTPGPTVVFTLGVLLTAAKKIPKHLLFIPLCYCVAGLIGSLLLNTPERMPVLLAGLIASPFILRSPFS